jgi:anionic cell wall polymer biosynthesis LytR-Cps2A-Psr (LCP) family protein
MKVDHYVEIGMGGVAGVVDAVGGVELCLDYDVDDEFSQLHWTAGCHVVDGTTALAFARMRYSDPLGDIGRAQRQQQLISAVSREVGAPGELVLNPSRQVGLIRAGTQAFVVDESTGIVDLARMALAFRAASGPDGLHTTPPIADPDYRPGGVGSTVLLDEAAAADFFAGLAEGTIPPTPAATP